MHTGIGMEEAGRRLRAAIDLRRPSRIVSGGFAGGLDPGLEVADLVADSTRSDASLLAAISKAARQGTFLSVSRPLESIEAKATAFRETGALAVDMETGAIAKVCSERGIPVLFLRAISDSARDEIPLPFEATYDLQRQRSKPLGVCLALIRAPSRIPRFARFLGNLKRARAALTREICKVLAKESPFPTINGD